MGMYWVENQYEREARQARTSILLAAFSALAVGGGVLHHEYVELPKKALVAEFDAKAARTFGDKGYAVRGRIGNLDLAKAGEGSPDWQTCYALQGAGAARAGEFKGCVASIWPAPGEGEWKDPSNVYRVDRGTWQKTDVDGLRQAVKQEPIRVKSITPLGQHALR